MKISVRWGTITDSSLRYMKQLGVQCVDLGLESVIENFRGMHGFYVGVELNKVRNTIKKVREAGLPVNSFCDFPPIRHALMDRPDGEKQLKDACDVIKLLGEESVPLMQLCLETVRHGPGGCPGRFTGIHRGGYTMGSFSLSLMRRQLSERDMNAPWAHHFKDRMTPEEYFDNCIRVLERVIPVAEEAGVKLMIHFDDPPVPDNEGLLPGITNSLQINRLLDAAPSKNVGLLFCCGTRYESGEDLFKQIRTFGGRGKIFHVHLRNVRGTLPIAGGYDEVAIDDGDVDMFQVLGTLKSVGYDAAINPDHSPNYTEDKEGRAGVVYSLGYIKALLSVLRCLNP